jgi:uncharacterized OsmC-like protein
MADPAKIREMVDRNVKLLSLKPDRGHLTAVTKARIVDGLSCEVEEGKWKLTCDLPEKAGGEDTGPTPGMLGRGALASCLAMGLSLWAARLGVPIDAIDVEVQSDFDARAELGMDGFDRAGYDDIRYIISIDSPASEDDLANLLSKTEQFSPYLDTFGRAQQLGRVVRLNGKEI